MSLLATIKVDVKKFFSDLSSDAAKFCAAFVKIFKEAPTAIQVVENFVNEVAPVVVAALAIADPALDPEAIVALNTIQVGLAGIEAAATAATTGTSLVTALTNFAGQVPSLLTSLDIKNPALKATVTKIVNLVTSEAKVIIPAAQAWVAELAAKATPTPAPADTAEAAPLPA